MKGLKIAFANIFPPKWSKKWHKTHNTYIIMKIYKESYINHKDSIRIVITHEDCGNIEILNNLWYNAVNSINLNLTR